MVKKIVRNFSYTYVYCNSTHEIYIHLGVSRLIVWNHRYKFSLQPLLKTRTYCLLQVAWRSRKAGGGLDTFRIFYIHSLPMNIQI